MIKTIYLDMDGVLDDFDSFADRCKIWREDVHKVNWKKVDFIGEKFWFNIKPFEDGLWLYEYLLVLCDEKNIKLKILSAGPGEKCNRGKRLWLEKWCPEIKPEDIIIEQKGIDKAKYASSDSILIDDAEKNIEAFQNAGGLVYHYQQDPKECLKFVRNHCD